MWGRFIPNNVKYNTVKYKPFTRPQVNAHKKLKIGKNKGEYEYFIMETANPVQDLGEHISSHINSEGCYKAFLG